MQCKYHPNIGGEFFCVNCNASLCKECAEEGSPGEYYCFQCAMLRAARGAGASIQDEPGKEIAQGEKKRWGPFHYFVTVSLALILVMWGVIIFGGQPSPGRTINFAKKGRVLLFMVDGALKRYAFYEGDRYPQNLSDLIPKYLSIKKNERFPLQELSYQKDPTAGYRLSIANPESGEMNLILSPKGIEYTAPSKQET